MIRKILIPLAFLMIFTGCGGEKISEDKANDEPLIQIISTSTGWSDGLQKYKVKNISDEDIILHRLEVAAYDSKGGYLSAKAKATDVSIKKGKSKWLTYQFAGGQMSQVILYGYSLKGRRSYRELPLYMAFKMTESNDTTSSETFTGEENVRGMLRRIYQKNTHSFQGTWKLVGAIEEGSEISADNIISGSDFKDAFGQAVPDSSIKITEEGLDILQDKSCYSKVYDPVSHGKNSFIQKAELTGTEGEELENPITQTSKCTISDGYLFLSDSFSDPDYDPGNTMVYRKAE